MDHGARRRLAPERLNGRKGPAPSDIPRASVTECEDEGPSSAVTPSGCLEAPGRHPSDERIRR